jgi:hypothetical protein
MMLMRDDPSATLLAQSDGQAKAVVGILPELLMSPTAEQRMRERHVVACGLCCALSRDGRLRSPSTGKPTGAAV